MGAWSSFGRRGVRWEGAVWFEGLPPSFSVGEVVVVTARQYEVLHVGGATVFPWHNVVGVAPFGGPVAAFDHAAVPVAESQRREQRRRGGAGGAAVVEDGAPPVGEHSVDVGVAQQHADGVGVEEGVVEGAATRAGFELVDLS